MRSLKGKAEAARASEERYRSSFGEAVMAQLSDTPEEAAWCEAALEALWEYDGESPFRAAVHARRSGRKRLYERALADDARISALAKAANAAAAK